MKFPKLMDDVQTTVYAVLPSSFGAPLIHTENWLRGKRLDDGAENLWRIHDKLYDFTEFVKRHPGGPDWLSLTHGTDITEAFETHHMSVTPENLLVKYYVRNASQKRFSPFTFNENGFYRTLKRRVRETIVNMPEGAARKSKIIADLLVFTTICLAIFATLINSFIYGPILGLFAGVTLALAVVAGHNFSHQRDNFRMYYMDFGFLRSRDWRVTHNLSHHLYTNTTNDVESLALPHFYFLPSRKHFLLRYFPHVAFPAVFGFMFFGYFVRSIYCRLIFCNDGLKKSDLIPFILPAILFSFGWYYYVYTAIIYVWIMCVGSFYFTFIGVVACHHHPNRFHDGDVPRSIDDMDWGINQLDTSMDRKEINSCYFLILTSFGDHTLHHLFPTLDHACLPFVRPIVEDTCKDFGMGLKMTTQYDCAVGAFKQLTREPNNSPPKSIAIDHQKKTLNYLNTSPEIVTVTVDTYM